MKKIAVVGGGIAGVTAAWQLARLRSESTFEVTLFEASTRLGGIVETVHDAGFLIECGPDGWVTEKPWARELALELGLDAQLQFSRDEGRKTYICIDKSLVAMPDGMRMMVPGDLSALERTTLFSAAAQTAFAAENARAEELRDIAPREDESVATFVRRHFGDEVVRTVAAPLLSGVFGGDVERLSVQAVMPGFVAMEREFGSLIAGVQSRFRKNEAPIFTTLKNGLRSLVDRMVMDIPEHWIRIAVEVSGLRRDGQRWMVQLGASAESFDAVMLALPVHGARRLMQGVDPQAAKLMEMEATSALVVGLGFAEDFVRPPGFGFLVPASESCALMACTFMDQKFDGRVQRQGRLLRAFFGGAAAERLLHVSDADLVSLAMAELRQILGALPEPIVRVVRRWPESLPQYHVGHKERMHRLDQRIAAMPGICLLGNGYRGVGLPDLIRDARTAARAFALSSDQGDLPLPALRFPSQS